MTNVVYNEAPKWRGITYRSCFIDACVYFLNVKKAVLIPIRCDHKMELLKVQHDPWKVANNKEHYNSE